METKKQCLVCGNDFEPKNPKGLYCSSVCRQKDYRKRTAEVLKSAREGSLLNYPPTIELEPPKREINKNTSEDKVMDNEAILEQIKTLRAEKIPEHRNKSEWGRKSWRQEQDKRIQDLKNQLK